MITEEFRYARLSELVANAVILEPDLTHESTFLQCDLVDPELFIESLYRIYRIARIHAGRQPLSYHKVRDPIITVEESAVRFEAFSLDMTNYAALSLNENAFTNVKSWTSGQTNIDLSPAFIAALRANGPARVNTISIDPDAFKVKAEESELIEKKIDLPPNWTMALDNIRGFAAEGVERVDIEEIDSVVNLTPFKPFAGPFATVQEAWVPREGWQFTRLALRSGLGEAYIGRTVSKTDRFDGRQNPRYEAIRDLQMLRRLKSFILVVERVYGDVWQVSGGGRVHVVQKRGPTYTCDCKDSRYGPTTCKHVRAVTKPRARIIALGPNSWRVITQEGKQLDTNLVELDGMKFTCTCKDFGKTNICQHVVEVIEKEEDFQFDELVEDLS
jgi:hypothetical protein